MLTLAKLLQVARSDVVINLVGREHVTSNFDFDDVHVKLAHKIAKISKEAGVARFIQMSAMGACSESSSSFLRSKAAGENVVRGFFPNATIIRPNLVYGHEDRLTNRFATMLNLWPFVPLVNGGNSQIQPVWCQDLSAAVVAVLDRSDYDGKVLELAGREVFTYNELLETIAKHIYLPCTTVKLPLDIVAVMGEIYEKFAFQHSKYLTEEYAERMNTDIVLEKKTGVLTFDDLGITPAPFMPTALAALVRHSGTRGPHEHDHNMATSREIYAAQMEKGVKYVK